MNVWHWSLSNDGTNRRNSWWSILTVGAAAALLAAVSSAVLAQDVDVVVFSTEPAGGDLVASRYDFATPIRVQDRLGFCPGGQCFYSSTDPGYRTPSSGEPSQGLHALLAGTPVSFEIVAIDAGVSIKWGSTVLDGVGQSTRIGDALALHEHPEYQLEASEGVVGDFELSFRLTSPQYGDSEVRSFTLTNGDAPPTATLPAETATPSPTETSPAPPTFTPTPVDTATPTDTPTNTRTPTQTVPPNDTCDGDCDGDGSVSIAELIRGVNMALGALPVTECPAFDINDDGTVAINELISAVNDALNGC